MKKFAVIGNPVAHSLSPALHNWIFNNLGLDAEYKRIKVDKDKLSRIVTRLRNGNLDGINVTLPHKQEIIPLLDDINLRAKHINAVNCIVKKRDRIVGYNTDWYGFTMLLRQNKIIPAESTFIILGAGGVAKSVLYTLIQKGVKTVIIVNRTPERSQSLIESMAVIKCNVSLKTVTYDKLENILPPKVILVNCTPLGMTPRTNTTPIPSNLIQKDYILIDTVYTPPETQFLKDGKTAGAQVVGGLEMFIYQGLASLDLWFIDTISQEVNIKELRTYLELTVSNERL